MGKYTNYSDGEKAPHAIWRGIGCLMMIIIPAISIAIGYEIVNYAIASEWPIPYQLMRSVRMPDIFYSTKGLRTIFYALGGVKYFYAYAAASFIIMVLLSGVISVIYAAVYRIIGPSCYGPTDAPPTKFKATKKSR